MVFFGIIAIMNTIVPKDAEKMIGEGGVVVLDVRSPEEYAEGHLAGAINMNINDAGFADNVRALDRDKKYVVYCLAGGRGGRAVSLMNELGFKDAKNLVGGITVWKSEGLPVEK